LIDCNNYFLRNFTYVFIIIFLIALFDAYYQNFYEVNIFGISTELNSRLVLLFNDQAYLGGYLSRLVPLLIGLIIFIFYLNKNRTYLFVCLLLILTDVAVYLSGERTAIVLLLIASLSIIIFIRNFRLIRIITLMISVFIVFLFSIFDSELKNRNIDATYNQIFQQKQGKIAIFSTHHESHYITAFRMFKDKPILGHGPNSFRYACNIEKYNYDERSCSTHPHNIYIQLAAEIGIIGLLVFLIFPIYIFYLLICHFLSHFSIKFKKISDFEVCLITAFILTVFPFLPSLNFFNNYINIIYYLPIGFFLYSYNMNKDK
ncbi:O-antigen ligase family protein, partial [Pelagibacteraceae bacterium]|nr:O-antigen ligase family protein [Pelagibacteraceae bacterium]